MKLVLNKDKMQIVQEQDVVPFRNRVKEYAVKIGMSLLNQTKLITAASELVNLPFNTRIGLNDDKKTAG